MNDKILGMTRSVKLAPSILAADFGRLRDQVIEVTDAGADYIHLDIMDGHFVPNITFGPAITEAVRMATSLPLNVHLMIENPEKYIPDFVSAGADHIIIHSETSVHLNKIIHQIKNEGLDAGIAINPSTSLGSIEELLPYVDIALVSTVNPGFSGQQLIPETLGKVSRIRELIFQNNYSMDIQVDGGINTDTAKLAVDAGATILVAGAAVFNKHESIREAMGKLRKSLGRPNSN